MEVYNENFFVGLDDYELTWELVADGRVEGPAVLANSMSRPGSDAPMRWALPPPISPAGQGAAGERGLQTETNSRC
ncbi:MAG: beta-galactosidase domain 4-containing protein [Alistipes finegoldii]